MNKTAKGMYPLSV